LKEMWLSERNGVNRHLKIVNYKYKIICHIKKIICDFIRKCNFWDFKK